MQMDAEVAALDMFELPSARGCTYVVPRDHFEVALLAGRAFSGSTEIKTAQKHFGLTEADVSRLCDQVIAAFKPGEVTDPRELKDRLGDKVRNFGEEGKKRGLTTSLPMALQLLQSQGTIRRVPVNGRLDQQRYGYQLWSDSPMASSTMSAEEAYTELARLYFGWIGPATMANFQWFSALGVGAAKRAVEPLDLVEIEKDWLMLPDDVDAFDTFEPLTSPQYRMLAGLDSIVLLRRNHVDLLEPEDRARESYGEKANLVEVGRLSDLPHHAIFDRGRIVGVWEFDSFEGRIVSRVWGESDAALRAEIERTEAFVREELGDARSFSLDSPESRRPRVEALRG
jgi:hypothetical protein